LVCLAESFVRKTGGGYLLRVDVAGHSMRNMAIYDTKRTSSSPLDVLKQSLYRKLEDCQPNGIDVSIDKRLEIDTLARQIEKVNPTKNPAKSQLMNGFWRMLYTDIKPVAASNGKLGIFIGDVFQDLDSNNLQIKNLLQIQFPPIKGALVASLVIPDNTSWRITFEKISNTIFNFKLPEKQFPQDKDKEVRIWKITYLDKDLRIMRAGRPESPQNTFLFVFRRDEGSRFGL